MGIWDQIRQGRDNAVKKGNDKEISVYESIAREIDRLGGNTKTGEVTDDTVILALVQCVTTRLESMEQNKRSGRNDLLEKNHFEIELISRYLPEALSHDELKALIDESIAETGAKGADDLDKVMKVVMPKIRGREDAETVRSLVMERLIGS